MLSELREKVDEIDASIVNLLNERARLSLSIGETKRKSIQSQQEGQQEANNSTNVHVYVPGREKKVFAKVSGLNKGPLSDASVQAIYREIMSASISLQQRVTVGFLGPAGTFTHQAALERFGDSVQYVPFASISAVFENMVLGRITYAVVPFENSTNGPVTETLDEMHRQPKGRFQIRAETFLAIEHCLLAAPGMELVERIYSHEQAFGQCRDWLKGEASAGVISTGGIISSGGVKEICVSSTAEAAEKCSKDVRSAAIASSCCASIYGLQLLVKGIQDGNAGGGGNGGVKCINTTRFLILANEASALI